MSALAAAALVAPTRATVRSAYALMSSVALSAALGFAYWLVAARWLPSDAVGDAAAALALCALVAAVSQLNLGVVLLRYLPGLTRGRRRLLVTTEAVATVTATAAMAVLVLPGWVPGLRGADAAQRLLLVALAPVLSLSALQDAALSGLGRALLVPFETTAFGALKLLALLVPVGDPVTRLLASWLFPALLVLVPTAAYTARRARHAPAVHTAGEAYPRWRDLGRFVGMDYLAGLGNTAKLQLLPLVVHGTLGASATAAFSIAWQIGNTPALLATGMAASVTLEGAAGALAVSRAFHGLVRHFLLTLVPLSLAGVVVAPVVMRVLGDEYVQATGALRLVLLASIPGGLVWLGTGLLRAHRRLDRLAALQVTSAVALAAAASAAAVHLGLTATALAWLVVQSVLAAALLCHLRRWDPAVLPRPAPPAPTLPRSTGGDERTTP